MLEAVHVNAYRATRHAPYWDQTNYDEHAVDPRHLHAASLCFWKRHKTETRWHQAQWSDVMDLLRALIRNPQPKVLLEVTLRNAQQGWRRVALQHTDLYFELEHYAPRGKPLEIVGQLRVFRSNGGVLLQIEKHTVGCRWEGALGVWIQKYGQADDGIYCCVALVPALGYTFFQDDCGSYSIDHLNIY